MSLGSWEGRQVSVIRPSAAGSLSTMTCAMSTALTPSTSAWWDLVTMAKRPSSSPSTR